MARISSPESWPRTDTTIDAVGSFLSRENSARSGRTRWTRVDLIRASDEMVRANSPSRARTLLMFWTKLVAPSEFCWSKIS